MWTKDQVIAAMDKADITKQQQNTIIQNIAQSEAENKKRSRGIINELKLATER